MDELSQSALLHISLHLPVSLIGAVACCSRFLASLFNDTSSTWSWLYNLHFCSTQEAVEKIIPTTGLFWSAGRFKTAFVEQYLLQYLSFLAANFDEFAPNKLKIFYRSLVVEPDIERWLRIVEDDERSVIGTKPSPVYFAYHGASDKSAPKRDAAKLKAHTAQKESHIHQLLQQHTNGLPEDHPNDSPWFKEAAIQFVESFNRSASEGDDVEEIEWIETGPTLASRLVFKAVTCTSPDSSRHVSVALGAFTSFCQVQDGAHLRGFLGVSIAEDRMTQVKVAFVCESRILFFAANLEGSKLSESNCDESLRMLCDQ